MRDPLLRAQGYLDRARQLQKTAQLEIDVARRDELLKLAAQYEYLSEKIMKEHSVARPETDQ